MLRLVSKLSANLSAGFRKRATAREAVPTLPLKPGTTALTWTPAEVKLLLNCEHHQRQFLVHLPGRTASAKAPAADKPHCRTRLLGVDFTSNQLLLDTVRPALPAALLAAEEPFWLSLQLNTGEYRLCVMPREWMHGGYVLADILSASFAAHDAGLPPEQQPEQPVAFHPKDGRLPTAHLRLGSGLAIQAKVANLAADGAQLVLSKTDAAALRTAQTGIRCNLTFNNNFTLQCHGRTDQPPRSQGKSLVVNVEFTHMDAGHQVQLRAFLRACESSKGVAA